MLEIRTEVIKASEIREGMEIFGGKLEVTNPFYGQSTYVGVVRGQSGNVKTARIPESSFHVGTDGEIYAIAILQDGNGKGYNDYDTDVRDLAGMYTQAEKKAMRQGQNQTGGNAQRAQTSF
jgi:hypothetical protein